MSSRRSTERRVAAIVLLGAVAVVTTAPAVAAATPREDLDAVLAEGGYQTEMPDTAVREPTRRRAPLAALGPLARLLVYVTAGVVVLLLIAGIVHWIVGRDRRREERSSDPLDVAEEGYRARLGTVERLAGEGRYDEALHELLLVAIGTVVERLSIVRGRSTTSREIGARLPPDFSGRRAFGELVRAVETSYFGGEPVSGEEFRRHLDAYRDEIGAVS